MLLDCSVQVYNQPRFSASQLSSASAHLGFAVGSERRRQPSRADVEGAQTSGNHIEKRAAQCASKSLILRLCKVLARHNRRPTARGPCGAGGSDCGGGRLARAVAGAGCGRETGGWLPDLEPGETVTWKVVDRTHLLLVRLPDRKPLTGVARDDRECYEE
jgi:hypothetical protein